MTSDFALQVPAELDTALQVKTVQYLVTQKTMLDLYGVDIKPVAPFGSLSRRQYHVPALIHRCLPDQLQLEVCNYRYMRFFPCGRFLYKTSSHTLKDIVKSMNF